MKSYGLTDKGAVRKDNQDCFILEKCEVKGCLIAALCDGMGGAKAGGIASQLANKAFVSNIYAKLTSRLPRNVDYKRILENACAEANGVSYEYSHFDKDFDGMGTTVVASTYLDGILYVANVGDSRLYVIGDDIKQITRDHSLVEEMVRMGGIDRAAARNHPDKNIITRAIGAASSVNVDYFEVALKPEDIVLMCSDGLTNMIEDKDILEIVRTEGDLKTKADLLIKTANENGGKDNIAVLLMQPDRKTGKEGKIADTLRIRKKE